MEIKPKCLKLTIERGFQCTKVCLVWNSCAKVISVHIKCHWEITVVNIVKGVDDYPMSILIFNMYLTCKISERWFWVGCWFLASCVLHSHFDCGHFQFYQPNMYGCWIGLGVFSAIYNVYGICKNDHLISTIF